MAYGRQYQGVRQDYRLGPDQITDLNTRLQYLPERIAQQKAEEQAAAQLKYQYTSLAQQKKIASQQAAQSERENQAALGLEVGKLGLNVATNPGALKPISGAIKPLISGSKSGVANATGGGRNAMGANWTTGVSEVPNESGSNTGSGGFFGGLSKLGGSVKGVLDNMNFSNTIGSGLAGYGLSKMIGGDNKWKKFGVGAAAGGLMGLFTGGGSGWADSLKGGSIGSIFGGLGGLFS